MKRQLGTKDCVRAKQSRGRTHQASHVGSHVSRPRIRNSPARELETDAVSDNTPTD
jgi:hypothetical protein